VVVDFEGDEIEWIVCPHCHGSKHENKELTKTSSIRGLCSKCSGKGKILVKKKDGSDVVLERKGML